MIVTIKVPGQDEPARYEFDARSVPMSVADVIERRWSAEQPSYEAWLAAVEAGSARARRVLAWYVQWRDHPKLRFDDVDPPLGTVTVEYTRAELERAIGEVETRKRMDPATREAILNGLREQLDDAPEGTGKADSPPSSTTTGSS